MATTTENLSLTKPAYTEAADVAVINENADKLDTEAGKVRSNFAAKYSTTQSYSVGDYCTRSGNLYRCTTAIASGGESWNSSHWTSVNVTDEIPKLANNLTTTSAGLALDARQGRILNNYANTDTIYIGRYLTGVANADGTSILIDIMVPKSVPSNATFTTYYDRPSALYKADGTGYTVPSGASISISRQAARVLRMSIQGLSTTGNAVFKIGFAGVQYITINVS